MAVAAALAALAGCSVFSGPPPETFDLNAPQTIASLPGATSSQILVPEAVGLHIFDSERIVVMSGLRVSYYPDSQYPDTLPKLFQARVIEAFERTGRTRAVGRPGQGLSIDYQLLTDIRAFQYADLEGVARVEITAKVMNDRNGRVLATRTFKGEAAVPENNAVAVVQGLDAALQIVLADIIRWTLQRV